MKKVPQIRFKDFVSLQEKWSASERESSYSMNLDHMLYVN